MNRFSFFRPCGSPALIFFLYEVFIALLLILALLSITTACHTSSHSRTIAKSPGEELTKRFRLTGHAQGTTWMISYYAHDSLLAHAAVDSLLARLDRSLSIYQPNSLISRFNRAEKEMELDPDLYAVVKKALHTYRATGGKFDFTVQPLVRAWGFGNADIPHPPDSATIKALLSCVGSDLLTLKGKMLMKKKPCVTIDVNGIAQGYSVDRMAELVQKSGAKNFVVELGGEIRVSGKRPSGEPMRIGIETPAGGEEMEPYIQQVIAIDRGAITTSGSYRKAYEWRGRNVHHIIDPATGYPSRNELLSVTVYAPDALTADAYDNALMLMGLEKALQFVSQHRHLAAHFIFSRHNGEIADTASSRFPKLISHMGAGNE